MNTQPGKIQYAAACSHSAALLISSRHSMPLISSHSTSSPLPTGSALTFVSPLLTTGTGVFPFPMAIEMGNTVSNQRSIDVNSRFNLEALYNKVPYLKKVNRRFSASYRKPASPKEQKPRRFDKEVQLRADTTVTIQHGMNSRRPKSHRSHSGRTSLSRTL